MAHPLDDAYAKAWRAKQYLKELHQQSVGWVNAHPYDIVTEVDAHTGRHVGVARAQGPEEAIPVGFGIQVGECVHNMRSALDYVAWQLAQPPVGTGPGDTTQFPLFMDRISRPDKAPAPERYAAAENRFLRGIRPEHRAVIERLQPYHGRHRLSLGFIGAISDLDKHRIIPTLAMSGNPYEPSIMGTNIPTMIRFKPSPEIYDGAVVWEELDTFRRWPRNMKVETASTYAIGFGESDLTGDVGTLIYASNAVMAVLRIFTRAFAGPPPHTGPPRS